MSFRAPWSLGNLKLVDYFPTGSQAFYHEIVIRFEKLLHVTEEGRPDPARLEEVRSLYKLQTGSPL